MAIPRRAFLKATSAAAGAAAFAGLGSSRADAAQTAASVRIGETRYPPGRDFAIQPQRYSAVTLTDAFWKPKVDRNASVTIPFEVQKRADGGGRGFSGNVLEAAMLSLKTHPNPTLQAQVEARVRAMAQAASTRQRRLRSRGDLVHAHRTTRSARPGDQIGGRAL